MLNILVEPIKAELGLDDIRFSLLQGLAFSVVYCLSAFPVAILADRYSRKHVILASLLIWNVMTLLFGLSTGFGMMLVARMGLALGEAGLTPAAISIIRQVYPPERQPMAVSWIALSLYLGGGLSMAIAGPALDALSGASALPFGLTPWRVLFVGSFAVGVVGLLLVSTMREPARPAIATDRGASEHSFRDLLRHLARRWPLVLCYLAAGIALNGIVYAVMSWAPAMLMRNYGWTTYRTGLSFGAVYMLAGGAGSLLGGRLVPRLRSSETAGSVVRLMRIACLLAGSSLVLASLSPDGLVALGFLFLAMLGVGALVGVNVFGFQALFPAAFSARAVAINFLVAGTLGSSLGPSGVAMIKGLLGGGELATGPALGWFAALATLWGVIWLSLFLTILKSRSSADASPPRALRPAQAG